MRELGFFVAVLTAVSVSCSPSDGSRGAFPTTGPGASMPALEGSAVGNGGDSIRVLVEQGRLHALRAIGALKEAAIPSVAKRTLREGEIDWLLQNKELLAEDVRLSEHRWMDEIPPSHIPYHSCASTGLTPSSPILLSLSECSLKVRSRAEAGQLLIHESTHHLLGDDEGKADRLAAAVYMTWLNLGHPDGPHWNTIPGPPGDFREDLFEKYQGMLWTGSEIIFLSVSHDDGDHGKIDFFHPDTGTWRERIPGNAKSVWKPRGHGGVRTDFLQTLAAWGNNQAILYNTDWRDSDPAAGVIYNAGSNLWEWLPKEGAPVPDAEDSAVAHDGKRLVVWGGAIRNGDSPNEWRLIGAGAVFDFRAKTWEAIPDCPFLAPRTMASAVLAGDHLLIWGGTDRLPPSAPGAFPSTGAVIDLKQKTCRPMSTLNAPRGRLGQTAVWTGKAMLIYGGFEKGDWWGFDYHSRFMASGGLYDPIQDEWRPISPVNAPIATRDNVPRFLAQWTGVHLIALGDKLAFYSPETDRWDAYPALLNPTDWWEYNGSFWTGVEWILWEPTIKHGFALIP